MGIRSLRIEFTDGQNGVYDAGQRLKGRVVIDFDKATKVNNTNDKHHPPGQRHAFEYHLPPNIPSSFETDIGRVRYLIKCVIDRPWKFDHKTKIPFTVNSVLDLNQYPNTRVITFKPRGGYIRTESNVVCSVKRGAIRPGNSDIWNGR